MTVKVKWKFIYSVFITLGLVQGVRVDDRSPSKDFTEHSVTKPRIYHGRSKREISDTSEPGVRGAHTYYLIISLDLEGIERILELTINHDLIGGSYFQKTQVNGSHHIHRPTAEELELCHYRGFIRDIPDSWAAVSTCSGLKGIVYDGNNTYYIDVGPENGTSYVYNSRNIKANKNYTCGTLETHSVHRLKRDADTIRGPYNANRQSRYVELLLVVDHEEYKELGDLKVVFQHCKDIANIINALFEPLNIFIALIGVVVWTEQDEISISPNGDLTLTNFLHYRREFLVKEHPNDNAQLLTRIHFNGGVVGKALKGPICTFEYSGGVFMDHNSVVGVVATTVAHELGHNFGMEHDSSNCRCPDDRCIMASSSTSESPSHWSSCSLEYLAVAFEHGMDYCLRNKPEKLFDSPDCGNGFVEPGEQCDCGLPHRCDNPCCNATSCMLLSNASCATGECCDFQTCKPKNAGTVCRSADHECDLPEYCTGESEYCPGDVFKIDGEPCNNNSAFCYQGMCRTHSDQCQLLWGPTGENSDVLCYEKNLKGSRHGNCGYNRLNQSYIKCYNENIYCGMVHCVHLNERLEFGMESVSILSHSFINKDGEMLPCRTAIVDLGWNEVDPGLAPNGAKCGDGKMCVNQKCVSVGEFRKMSSYSCPGDCSGNGICNSKGHCHCVKGFAPPLCDYPGTGGSVDSGPASDPNLGREFIIALYVIFLCAVPLLALALIFMYYTKQNAKIWWKKSPTRLSAPWEFKRQSPSGGTVVLLPESVGVVDVGIIQMNRSPLRKGSDISETSSQPKTLVELQSDLFGKGKGFAIKPLKKSNNSNRTLPSQEREENNVPGAGNLTTPARYENIQEGGGPKEACSLGVKIVGRQNSWKNEDGRLRVISPPTLPTDTTCKNSNVPFPKKTKASPVEGRTSDNVDAAAPTFPSRPQISEPVLEGTTARDLISEGAALVPTRKAPEAPKEVTADVIVSGGSGEKYEKAPPPVPVHRVDINSEKQRPLSSPVESAEEKKLLRELKESKEYPTLTKLASLMKNASSNINRSASINEKSKLKVKVEPKKIKFDREKLKNIMISNPIPQVEALDKEKKETNITRAQSMREPGQGKLNLPNFGSFGMGGGKRPTSIHVPNRPTSPPPRPPPPKPLNQEYAYDDCLNLLSEKVAPLAHIDEESTPSPNNIYAVIEESPKLETERKVHFSDEKRDATNGNKTTKPLNADMSSGSMESMGLLGEIVSEIQARNLDSIYSSGTLKKKKNKKKEEEEEEEEEEERADEDDVVKEGDKSGGDGSIIYNANLSSARSDVSSSSSGNGYLNPKNINSPAHPMMRGPETVDSLEKPVVKAPENEGPKGMLKPYSSSLMRSSGPLSNAYSEKEDSKKVKKVQVEKTLGNTTCTTSASQLNFNSSPLVSGAPTPVPKPSKFAFQDTAYSSSKAESSPENAEQEKAPGMSSTKKNQPSNPGTATANSKRTLPKTIVNNSQTPPGAVVNPKIALPKPGLQRNSRGSTPPGRSATSGEKDGEAGKPRALPSSPRKTEVKSVAKNAVVSRPLPAIPRRNSKENLTKAKKAPTERTQETVNALRRGSNIAQLQSKFEGSNIAGGSENKRPIHPISAANKPAPSLLDSKQ